MSIELSPETAARITNEARRQGISVDVLVERRLNEHGSTAPATGTGPIPELPILYLGQMGALHRRDIYDDVR